MERQVAILHYAVASAAVHLIWEIGQLPLYSIWNTAPIGEQAFAIAHCTIGDVLIAGVSLLAAIILVGKGWPRARGSFLRVTVVATVFGLGYTAYSEISNIAKGSWAYADEMPLVPWLNVGLAPMLQWLLIPPSLLFFLNRRMSQ